MIYSKNPGDQLDLSLATLRSLVDGLEANEDNSYFASVCLMVYTSIQDAMGRIESQHKAEIELLKVLPKPAANG